VNKVTLTRIKRARCVLLNLFTRHALELCAHFQESARRMSLLFLFKLMIKYKYDAANFVFLIRGLKISLFVSVLILNYLNNTSFFHFSLFFIFKSLGFYLLLIFSYTYTASTAAVQNIILKYYTLKSFYYILTGPSNIYNL
jgi:hypothetical protein